MLGSLYWITGLSGAGKTTIGNALYYELRQKASNVIILDGDILKSIVGSELGYSNPERLERAKRYSQLCKVLVDQGMTVIICTIAMYDEIREWNRTYIDGYVEVFLDVEVPILKARNQKGLYSDPHDSGVKHVAGMDLEVEFPKNPNIVIKNDGTLSVEQCVEMIANYEFSYKDAYNKDTFYWNQYYQSHSAQNETDPSSFACAMVQHMEKGKRVLDLGCGNGRDGIFFMEQGINATCIDASPVAIDLLKKAYPDKRSSFLCDNFVSSKALFQIKYDYCYSRWTLHAISKHKEWELLNNVYDTLNNGGKFFIEARSINDSIYGIGTPLGKHEFLNDGHYRRFIDSAELEKSLKLIGFTIIAIQEGAGFSKTSQSDPVLVRVIAMKFEKGK